MRCFHYLLVLLLSSVSLSAQAGLTIHASRVIFEESNGETAVRIEHTVGDTPILMQAWLDDGTPDAAAGVQNLPFLLAPAVARMNPGDAQTVRILRTRDELPKDRESLLYFNVLEVPPEPDAAENTNSILFAMQARLKFFYRPKGLRLAPWDAPERVQFALASDGQEVKLRLANPTPYYITIKDLALAAGSDGAVLAELDTKAALAPMLEPFGEALVPLTVTGSAPIPGNAVVRYSTINDQGGMNGRQKVLGSGTASRN